MPFNLILTNAGLAAAANAIATSTSIGITTMKVGDGNGAVITPAATMTALVRTVWTGAISSLSSHGTNQWLCNAVIPTSSGGYVIREVGLFDSAGTMLAVGQFQATEKPLPSTGAASEIEINVVFEITNGAAVSVIVNPNPGGTLPTGGVAPAYLRKSGAAYGQSEWQDIIPATSGELTTGVTPLVANSAGLIRSLTPEVGKILVPQNVGGTPKWTLQDIREAASPLVAFAQACVNNATPEVTITVENQKSVLVIIDAVGNTFHTGEFTLQMERNGVITDLNKLPGQTGANATSIGQYVPGAYSTPVIGMFTLVGDGNAIKFRLKINSGSFQDSSWIRAFALIRPGT